MKFELKTENENHSKLFLHIFRTVLSIAVIIISCDIALKLNIISRNYQIDHECRILSIEKSASRFQQLSRLTKLKSKQRIWEFCREFVK